MRFLLVILCSISMLAVRAQQGSVVIHDHAGAEGLVEKHQYFNEAHSQIPGWRIQVLSTPSMTEAKGEKTRILQQFENQAFIVFEAPNYKVRLGNYRNRFDAYRDLQEVLTMYPNAFICKDLINVREPLP